MATTSSVAAPAITPAAKVTAVRVEDESSIGRSYSKKAEVVKGLGAERRKLRTTTWRDAYGIGSTTPSTLESFTLAKVNLATCTKEDLLAYLKNTWDLTTTLFAALADDSVLYAVPDKLRRPLIFYSAHPAALYANKMHQAGLMDHVHPYWQKLFETGVDEMSWDDMDVMQDEDFAWPTVAEVVTFRASVYDAVVAVVNGMPYHPRDVPITMDSPYWSLVMGFEHERIHLETSSVLIRQLPLASVVTPPGWRTAPSFALEAPEAAPANGLVAVPEGVASIGKPRDYPSFGWDNEYGHRDVHVPAFAASKFLVSNAEFLPFVMAGGYVEKRWWVSEAGDDEGWRWRCYRNATHPSFWVAPAHPDFERFHGGKPDYPYQKDDGNAAAAGTDPAWKLRTMFEIVPVPWDWPVEVNYLEAAAFLRWKAHNENAAAAAAGGAPCKSRVAYRMPTEAEYHMIRSDPAPYPAATAGRANADGVAWGKDIGVSAAAAEALAAGRGARVSRLGAAAGAAGAAAGAPLTGEAAYGRVLLPSGATVDGASAEEAASRAAVASAAGSSGGPGALDVALQPSCPGNVNMRWQSTTPVDFYPPSSAGFHDPHGNVWQWVEDHFAPLPGFEIHYMYDDFSTPCFDGWHTMILGGSWVSTGELASSFARYHFRRHFFQQLGFRYVRIEEGKEAYPGQDTVTNIWECGSAVSTGITNGYTKPADKFPFPTSSPSSATAAVAATATSTVAAAAGAEAAAAGAAAGPSTAAAAGGDSGAVSIDGALAYPARLAQLAAAAVTEAAGGDAAAVASAKVLHIGCGVGGGSIALVQAGFGRVVGVDASEPAIRHARVIQHHGQYEYERVREGVLTDTTLIRVPVAPGDRARITYVLHAPASADEGAGTLAGVCKSPEVLACGPYDAVVIDDQLTKQTQPLELLAGMAGLFAGAPHAWSGVVVVASANAWDPAVTPRNSWMGGFKMNGEDMPTLHLLKYNMRRQGFTFARAVDLPRLTRATARSYALDILEASVFTKTATGSTGSSSGSPTTTTTGTGSCGCGGGAGAAAGGASATA